MSQGVGLEKIYKYQVVMNKCASNKGVWEVVNWHRVIIYIESLVYVKLLLFYFFQGPVCLSKDSKSELTIINVADCKLIANSILLNIFALDVAFRLVSNFFFKSLLVRLKSILFYEIAPIVLFRDYNY